MFKEELYNLVVEKLNYVSTENDLGLTFAGGYDIVMYQNGTPQAVFTSDESKFDYKKGSVIPVAEEYNQETAFFDIADRSDYVCQYQLMFRLKDIAKIKTALEEYRAYFYANKYHSIDGYNVTFKTTRGSKQATYDMGAGNMLGRYKLDVYLTASKGYLVKDTDIWEIKEYGTTGYTQVKTIDDLCATDYNDMPSNKTNIMSHNLTTGNFVGKFRIPYEGDTLSETIYNQIMNKSTDFNTLFDLRETLNGNVKEYVVKINNGARTKKLNEPLFLEFDVVEN
jgi:hypothetical protein